MTNEELITLSRQLRNPTGVKGVEIGKMMYETNLGMILSAIKGLDLSEGDKVLEIGHGNCLHLPHIFNLTQSISYCGLDISLTMRNEAVKNNQTYINQSLAKFDVYDGKTIPYEDNSFNKCFTVNTVYFWEQPLNFLNQIYRVLKAQGVFVIVFGDKSYLSKQPFTEYGFKLYENKELLELISQTPFKILNSEQSSEIIKSKTGNTVNRIYNTVVLSK